MESLHLSAGEDELMRLYLGIAWTRHQGYSKRNSFVDELTSVITRWVSIQVDRLLLIIEEHETFETNVRVAGRLLPINNLCAHPVDHGCILDLSLLDLRNQLPDDQACVILPH